MCVAIYGMGKGLLPPILRVGLLLRQESVAADARSALNEVLAAAPKDGAAI